MGGSNIKETSFDHCVVVDFETTGLAPGFRPVEIAWLEFDLNFKAIDRVESLINPQIPIEFAAQQVHGISESMIADAPTLDDFMRVQHGNKFNTSNVLVVAHNAKFDLPIFAPFCGQSTPLCTMDLGRRFYPNADNYQLQSLAKLCGIKQVPTHRALDDVETCFALLTHFAKSNSMSINQLVDLSKSVNPHATMPFGKHKGQKISDLPIDYQDWLLKTLDPEDWIVQIVNSVRHPKL